MRVLLRSSTIVCLPYLILPAPTQPYFFYHNTNDLTDDINYMYYFHCWKSMDLPVKLFCRKITS